MIAKKKAAAAEKRAAAAKRRAEEAATAEAAAESTFFCLHHVFDINYVSCARGIKLKSNFKIHFCSTGDQPPAKRQRTADDDEHPDIHSQMEI